MPPASRRARYLGFVAHELKNPLATALWSCDLLKRMESPDRTGPKADKMIDVSLRALRRMRRLVDDFFTIERLIEAGYELRRETIPLGELVKQSIAALADKDGVRVDGIQLDVPDQAQVSGDPDMMKRALRALLEHLARPAAEPRISIVARAETGAVLLFLRAEQPPVPLVPPLPEERPSGDALGAVLGFAVAGAILDLHGATLLERDGAICLSMPA